PVGTTIAFIGQPGEDVPDVSSNGKPPQPVEESRAEAAQAPPTPPVEALAAAAPAQREEGERIKASPLARRIAHERGVDLASISGTGPEGRIIAEDVERAAEGAPAAAAVAAP